ncbi:MULTISPECIES: hypothetical protein [Streptomyces]|uniref:hypothetical protein n=1 Tax=Streptomyces TaxID=1883 RepID=UPI0023DD1026|nr:hypothetical protein [Streptomyces sp. FXJ1.172]WEP00599.1 hypothetical protein A6P39_043505 [Streptomyces sp. FXJ1.172]
MDDRGAPEAEEPRPDGRGHETPSATADTGLEHLPDRLLQDAPAGATPPPCKSRRLRTGTA